MVKVIITDKDGTISEGNLYQTDEKIIENTNFINSIRPNNKQIVKLNIIRTGKDTGFPGCKERNIEYEFKYDEKKKCYQY